jgi:ATP-dependent helicase/nuclease subunit A
MSRAPVDAAIRKQALDPFASFCVQAPAGSGKTELLTQRMLGLLAHCERPEEILAFTFTRKAAAEMRSRLLRSLQEASRLQDTDIATLPAHKQLTMTLARAALARDALQQWQLLRNSQRLRITTIDGFNSWLAARLPLQSGFGATPRIGTDMREVYQEAVRTTLAALEGIDQSANQVASLLRHLHGDLRKAESLLLMLLGKREQWLPLITALRINPAQARITLEHNLRVLLEELFDEAGLRLRRHEPAILSLLQFASAQLTATGQETLPEYGNALPEPVADAADQWQALARFFLRKDAEEFRMQVTVKNGFPAPGTGRDAVEKALFKDKKQQFEDTIAALQADGLLPLMQRLAGIPPASYPEQQWAVLADVATLLPLLAAQLKIAMRAAGLIDHTETALAAQAALGNEAEPTDLALLLDYRIRHILVDEFQDTSSLQYHLLQQLTAGWSTGDGRTLFIVGDGMQSCYGFRDANVSLFLRAREQVQHVTMELLQLQVNFRSTASVIQWINAVFKDAFPSEDDLIRGGVSYSASSASNPQSQSEGVHCRLYVQSQEGKDKASARAREARDVASRCLDLQQRFPEQSIAILVRNRGVLTAIVPALRKAGLRWNAEEIDPLLSYPEIADLFTLLRALLDPADITAWFAVLRCPMTGLQLADLEVLAQARKELNGTLWSVLQAPWPAGLSADAVSRLTRVVPLLQQARAKLQTLPLAELLEDVWMALGGPACIDEAALLDNVADFFALLQAAGTSGDIPDLQLLQEQLEKAHGSARDSSTRLHIMTIHKAKGLEFDHVILPGLERRGRSNSNSLLYWQEYIDRNSTGRQLVGLMPRKGAAADPLYDYLKHESRAREQLETTRLLYIAVTRAIHSAWLFGSIEERQTGSRTDSGSLLASILPQILADQESLNIEQVPLAAVQEHLEPVGPINPNHVLRRLPLQWQSPSSRLLPEPTDVTAAAEDTHDSMAAAIGKAVHLCLQLLVQHSQRKPDTNVIRTLAQRTLRPVCANKAIQDAAVNAVDRMVNNCLDTADAEWLFRTRHTQDNCELTLVDYRGETRREYRIDRSFIDEEGVRWIIDYKSSTPATEQSLDAFLQEQVDRYRAQLQSYGRLMQEMESRPLQLALYLTALPTPRLVLL